MYILYSSLFLNLLLIYVTYRLMIKLNRAKKPLTDNGPINSGSDLFDDITKSKELFKLLKKEIHPDRFIGNEELRAYAEECMMELGKIQHSYSSMIKLIKEMTLHNFPFSSKVSTLIQNP